MAAQDIITRTHNPYYGRGKLYIAPYATPENMQEVGNVRKIEVEYKETIIKEPDMQHAGGGIAASHSRVDEVNVAIEFSYINVVNLTRAIFGTAAGQDAGSTTGEPHKAYRGGLIRLRYLQPSSVTLNKAGTPVPVAEYEVRPEGIYIKPSSTTITDGDDVTVDYSYGDHVNIEALTTSAPELCMRWAAINEGVHGKPRIVDFHKVSQGLVTKLNLITQGNEYEPLPVSGILLSDPRQQGVGISRFMREQFA